jgi:hypothetical protein
LTGTFGVGTNGFVYALTSHNGALVAAGDFTTAGGLPANNIARWNGSQWQALMGPSGNGTNRWIAALTGQYGLLWAGGNFDVAGGLVSAHLAAYGPPDPLFADGFEFVAP